ncbi:hypothetical protein COLO4_37980 [Corchorus olitorius]|uniref:Protein kinase domain-containing protein n=1 Tax=Corchorus olitorius TaxID=93759 RepID=A0A1R3FXL9_9ROSI|nr:hypothetical protein COLO4_37980 [Corchorus olitorius]
MSMVNFSMIILITLFIAFLTKSVQPQDVPTDIITLNCGATSDTNSSDGRFWTGDHKGSKFGPFESTRNPSATYEADNQGGGSVPTVPYMTARVSTSEFNYSFPVTPGQKFLRLYFHPASYGGFHESKAFFSVKTGSFTLLKNFSASLVAQSLKVDSFVREFCLNVEENHDQILNLSFTPTSNDTYAFINGIEIVSMPTNLYYTPPDNGNDAPKFIGQTNPYSVNNGTALQTAYRLNVGGKTISPVEDSGDLFRLWSDDVGYMSNDSYLTENTTAPVQYTIRTPNYVAPVEVYQTARTMGPNLTYNKQHNLTWVLPVDSGFMYMVRLHFCEMQDLINKPSRRRFTVFINSQVAEPVADVIRWTEHSNVPTYKDYVLRQENNKPNLTIDLHPTDNNALYFDVILNGIEVFKLSNFDGNLAGLNPQVSPVSPPAESPNGKSKEKQRMVITGVGCAFGLLVLLLVLASMAVWRYKKSHNKRKSRKPSLLPEELCRHFSLDEIKDATRNFHDDLVIGKGGFGKVYKGFLDEGETVVAIKRLNPESGQGLKEFLTEIDMLSQLRHVHLVSLIGYCNEKTEMILVYDFMSNGTLSDHLYGTNYYDPLTWKQRLEICKGAAIGLNYLHTEVKHTVIHRDVKTNNILLDDKFTAKVSDFGLSKTDPKDDMLNTQVKGTFGYLDPEYARGHTLTDKSDVYSFGVVLFEVLCARKALDRNLPEVSLVHWARKCIADGSLYEVIDPVLKRKIAPECFNVFVKIAESCIAEVGVNRPSMSDVMEKLRFAIELQEAADYEKKKMDPEAEPIYQDIVFPVARDMDFDDESEISDSEFSTIDSSIFNRSSVLDSYTTGMTSIGSTSSSFLLHGSTSSSDLFSSNNNTKSTAH